MLILRTTCLIQILMSRISLATRQQLARSSQAKKARKIRRAWNIHEMLLRVTTAFLQAKLSLIKRSQLPPQLQLLLHLNLSGSRLHGE